MGRCVTMQLLRDIRDASVFALIANEATDISNKEQLCISLRWVDTNFVIHEDTLELIHLTKTDALTIVKVIQDFFVCYQLSITRCRGQAYDGASNMGGGCY